MPFNAKADTRRNLPPPFKPCDCTLCAEDRAQFRHRILRRQHLLNPSIKDCRLQVKFDWIASSKNAIQSHSDSKETILRLPDEVLLRLFRLSRFIPTTICLALTCKRLCSLYLEILKHRSAKEENRLWNSTNGFWKYQLIQNLSRGWIPQEVVRFCWSCWLFRFYGEPSRDFWRAKIPALSTTAPRETSDDLDGHYSEVRPSASPATARLSENVQDTTDTLRHQLNRQRTLQFAGPPYGPGDHQQYQNNWEVQFWLGERNIIGVNTSLAKDDRIRCPACVLKNNHLRLLHRGMKIVPGGQS